MEHKRDGMLGRLSGLVGLISVVERMFEAEENQSLSQAISVGVGAVEQIKKRGLQVLTGVQAPFQEVEIALPVKERFGEM